MLATHPRIASPNGNSVSCALCVVFNEILCDLVYPGGVDLRDG